MAQSLPQPPLTEQRRAYLAARREIFTNNQDIERPVDQQLLFGRVNGRSSDAYIQKVVKDVGGAFQSMDGSTDSTFWQLREWIRLQLGENADPVMAEIGTATDFSKGWVVANGTFLGPPEDHYNEVKDSFLDSSLKRLRLIMAIQVKRPHRADAERIWKVIHLAFSMFDMAFTLNRFLDRRYPAMREVPLPDGENIVHPDLRAAWALQRAWIRLLHYRSLFVGQDAIGLDHLSHTMWLVYAFLKLELTRVPHRPWPIHQGDRHPELAFMDEAMDEMIGALREMGDVLLVETRPLTADGPYSEQETMEFNAADDQIVASFHNSFDEVSRKWQLWAHLLLHAKEFEQIMNQEHVEDCLIEKRLVVEDEEWDMPWGVEFLSIEEQEELGHVGWGLKAGERNYGEILEVLRRISEVNRYRRNYLCLTDWSLRRPWEQLWYVFNTADGELDYLRETIAEFHQEIQNMKESERGSPDDEGNDLRHVMKDNITKVSNKWSRIFTIHPIASTDIPAKLTYWEDGCVICADPFAHSQTIIQLKCKHTFHFPCVRTYWDQPKTLQTRCPICRANEPMLYETMGIVPEVTDVWEYRTMMGDRWVGEHPDMDNSAWDEVEGEILMRSYQWEEAEGPRNLKTELFRVLEYRRQRNAARRQRLEGGPEPKIGDMLPQDGRPGRQPGVDVDLGGLFPPPNQ